MNTNSGFFKLNWKDILEGLGAAVLISVLQVILHAAQSGMSDLATLPFWLSLLDTAVKAGAGYLSVKLFSTKDAGFLGVTRRPVNNESLRGK